MVDIDGELALNDAFQAIEEDVKALMIAETISLGEARSKAPHQRGAYVILLDDGKFYIGEAAIGRSGLRDRFAKHLSGMKDMRCKSILQRDFQTV